MRKLLVGITLFLLAVSVFAQSLLTNDDIIEMVKTGLGEQVIIAKIKASKTKFDTSSNALKTLSEAKTPDSIVVAIIEKEKQSQEQSTALQIKNNEENNKIPEQGNLSDILSKKKVYILTNDIKSRNIITKELKRMFQIVDKIEESEFVIRYESYIEELGAGAIVSGNTATVRKLDQTVGLFNVIMPSLDEKSD